VNLLLNIFNSVPISDWYTSIAAIGIIIFLLLLVEIGLKYFNLPVIYTRKFIHIITGLIVCLVAHYLYSNIPILIFAASYMFIDLWALKKGKFKSIHPDSSSYGTFFYAISVFVLASLFWYENKPLFIITNLIMIVPDAMAAIVGEKFAKRYFVPLSEKKSLLGASTMFILAFIFVLWSLQFFYDRSIATDIMTTLIVSTIATVSELLSSRGSDNLSVPLMSGLFLYPLTVMANPEIINMILVGITLAGGIAFISYRFKFLDLGGSALAFVMGSIIFGFGGWSYTFPILGFFILSSILSKIGRTRKKQVESGYQKTNVRDFQQALANGGVATTITLLAFFSGIESLYYVYVASLAAATADTWGTELGIFSRSNPVLITNFKPVAPGTSGGISFIGSFSALAGSTSIVLISSFFYAFNINQFFIITLAGFFGSLADSIVGATLQGQYECVICGNKTESKTHCREKSNLIQGIKYIDNDIVNIFSISISSIAVYILIFYKII
jgi:uncharacterized protein (TIGR00297 family)